MSRRDELRKAQDARREQAHPWRAWYRTPRWRRRRARQLKTEPLCRKCAAQGMSRPATIVDHVIPHRGDVALFWHGELQSLCDGCHSSAKQREENEGFAREVGDDGWPTDPRHPFNAPRKAGKA